MRAAAVASEPRAEEAANRILDEGGTAADALIAGFLAASAGRAGALFCPVQALFAGPGAGARAFDGRARQPGRGLPRPRGAVKSDEARKAAFAAAPASLGALALVHAYAGKLSLSSIAAPAIELARAAGAPDRAAVLAAVSRSGPAALREAAVARPILAAVGRAEGGLLSEEDLAEVRPASASPKEVSFEGGRRAIFAPWPAPKEVRRTSEFVAVADTSGLLAVLGYAPDDEGILVPELGLTLPRDAIVVRRGIPRTTPGEPLPCAAPIAIGLEDHAAFIALGVRSPSRFEVAPMTVAWSDRAATGSMLLAGAMLAAGGTSAGGVVRSAETFQAQKVSLEQRNV